MLKGYGVIPVLLKTVVGRYRVMNTISYIRQGSVGRNTDDFIKNTHDLSHNQDIMNNFTWFAQERVSCTQQGSVEQHIEETEMWTSWL